ncbi:hypothetical protein FT663_03158 [Candidozyma haemuli var. vulneris]|nr:hypothetical protein FT662_04230 [[Candida] haemuloni var. vulneris]KAF3990493.1 hypothetical protein FT663_03158 [[Candida] haemuloni var. vulneris]
MIDAATVAVHWHDDNQPIYTADFQPSLSTESPRLATGGGDNNVRIWRVTTPKDVLDASSTTVQYLSTLRKHSQAVNVVRFDPSGFRLATASDDGLIIIWVLADEIIQDFGNPDDELKESWRVEKLFNTNSEVYDLTWSPDSKYIATGSMDNSVRVFDVHSGSKVIDLMNHNHYVQGISWDPKNEYLATQSADRSLHVYRLTAGKTGSGPSGSKHCSSSNQQIIPTLVQNIAKLELPITNGQLLQRSPHDELTSTMPHRRDSLVLHPSSECNEQPYTQFVTPSSKVSSCQPKIASLYHSESLQSFFRRLAFSPDGSLLLTPSGILKKGETSEDDEATESFQNTVYIYTRAGFDHPPICYITGFTKPTVAVKFSPALYKLDSTVQQSMFALPYKMIFAVATQNSVLIFDTQQGKPLSLSKNLHYSTITDLTWSGDGRSLIVTSAEGFCSVILITERLGIPISQQGKQIFTEEATSEPLSSIDSGQSKKSIPDPTEQSSLAFDEPNDSSEQFPEVRALEKNPSKTQASSLTVNTEETSSARVDSEVMFGAHSCEELKRTQDLRSQFMEPPLREIRSDPIASESVTPLDTTREAMKKRRIQPTQVSSNHPQ